MIDNIAKLVLIGLILSLIAMLVSVVGGTIIMLVLDITGD